MGTILGDGGDLNLRFPTCKAQGQTDDSMTMDEINLTRFRNLKFNPEFLSPLLFLWKKLCLRQLIKDSSTFSNILHTMKFEQSLALRLLSHIVPATTLENVRPENTYWRGSITVRLTSCLFCLELATLLKLNEHKLNLCGEVKHSQTGGQPYSDILPFSHSEFSKTSLMLVASVTRLGDFWTF